MAKKKISPVVSVFMPDELKQQLQRIAADEERSLSRTIVRLLKQALQTSEREVA